MIKEKNEIVFTGFGLYISLMIWDICVAVACYYGLYSIGTLDRYSIPFAIFTIIRQYIKY